MRANALAHLAPARAKLGDVEGARASLAGAAEIGTDAALFAIATAEVDLHAGGDPAAARAVLDAHADEAGRYPAGIAWALLARALEAT